MSTDDATPMSTPGDAHDTDDSLDTGPREAPSLLAAERHRFDPLSLVFGVLFATIASLALAGEVRPFFVEGEWIGPAILIALGLALITTLRRDH